MSMRIDLEVLSSFAIMRVNQRMSMRDLEVLSVLSAIMRVRESEWSELQ